MMFARRRTQSEYSITDEKLSTPMDVDYYQFVSSANSMWLEHQRYHRTLAEAKAMKKKSHYQAWN